MGQHVHDTFDFAGDDPVARWDAVRMARHLKDAHVFVAPMSWDLGRMHLHHLEDHQGPGPRTATPEEAPMPMSTDPEPAKLDMRQIIAAMSQLMEDREGIDGLRRELARAIQERDQLDSQLTATLQTLEEVRLGRDRAEAALLGKLDRTGELDTQVSLLSGDLETVTRERDQLVERLRQFIANLKREDWTPQLSAEDGFHWAESRPEKLAASLEEAVLEERVSTGDYPGIQCTQAHLGLATTRELLEEITTRIDLGHCGLGYRTVDSD